MAGEAIVLNGNDGVCRWLKVHGMALCRELGLLPVDHWGELDPDPWPSGLCIGSPTTSPFPSRCWTRGPATIWWAKPRAETSGTGRLTIFVSNNVVYDVVVNTMDACVRTCFLPWHESWVDVDGAVLVCHSHGGTVAAWRSVPDCCGSKTNGELPTKSLNLTRLCSTSDQIYGPH